MNLQRVVCCCVIAVVLGAGGHSLYAQCGPNEGGPATLTLPGFVFGNGCVTDVTLKYCYSLPTFYPSTYNIISVIMNPPCKDVIVDGGMLRELGLKLIKENPAGLSPCPPCPNNTPNFNVKWVTCVKIYHLPDGGVEVVGCPAALGACFDSYTVCCDAAGRHVDFNGHGQTADCTNPECLPVCPP